MLRMSATAPIDRETTAAARRHIDAADRARRWREEQRRADAARQAELDALKAQVAKLTAERDGLRDALGRVGAAAVVDEATRIKVLRRLMQFILPPADAGP